MRTARFLLGFIICALCADSAFSAATVTGTVYTRDGKTMKTWINFTALTRPVVGSNDIRPGWTVETNTLANGTFRVPLFQGDYSVQIGNETLDTFNISVPTNTATYDIYQLTTNALTPLTLLSAWVPATNGSAYGLRLPVGAALNYVWTCTNSTTGAGTWTASGGSGSTEYIAAGTNVTVVTNGLVYTISATASGSATAQDITNSLQALSLLLADTNTFAGTLRTYAEQRTNSTKIARTDFPNYFSASNYWDGANTMAAFTEFLERTEFGSSNYFGGVIRPFGGIWATNGFGAENQFLASDGAGKVFWKAETAGAGGSWFEEDGNGDLMPALTATSDSNWELDGSGDLQPQ